MDSLVFGTAGMPLSTEKGGTAEGVKMVRMLGLGCMELEFVRGVNLNEEIAALVKEAAKRNDVKLSVHGPYFINLNSTDPKITEASVQRILKSARVGFLAGAESLTFHAAYYLKEDKEKVYETVKRELGQIVESLRAEGNTIMIRPELTGKESQFGSLQELIRLSSEVKGVLPCIDFAHYFARYDGKYNTLSDFSAVLGEIEKELGRTALNNMHIHMSGIEHTSKGERRHLILEESEFNFTAVLKACKEFKAKGRVICESPNIEQDALLMMRTYEKL